MDNFYITLPSNVKNDYNDNTVANFKTKLATRLSLEGDWMVGLASISYTRSWNIKSENAFFHIEYMNYVHYPRLIEDSSFQIDLSDYNSVEAIVDEINGKIDLYELKNSNMKLPRLNINTRTNRISIKLTSHKNKLVFLKMSLNLCKILGFDKTKLDNYIIDSFWLYYTEWEALGIRNQFKWAGGDWIPEKAPDISKMTYNSEEPYNILPIYNTLYLYCDLVKPSFVGDSYSQLLRIIEVPSNTQFRDQISISYTNIHYFQLQYKEFDMIEIDIKDDLGERIPFLFGRTIVCLHFKRI